MRWILTKHKNTNRIQEMSCAVRLLKFFLNVGYHPSFSETCEKSNVFVKPNEQSSNLFENSAMARKGRQSQRFR